MALLTCEFFKKCLCIFLVDQLPGTSLFLLGETGPDSLDMGLVHGTVNMSSVHLSSRAVARDLAWRNWTSLVE